MAAARSRHGDPGRTLATQPARARPSLVLFLMPPVFLRARNDIRMDCVGILGAQYLGETSHAAIRPGAFQHNVIEARVGFGIHEAQILHATDSLLSMAHRADGGEQLRTVPDSGFAS